MDKASIFVALEKSLSENSSTPTLGKLDREEYLRIERNKLREALIDPFLVNVKTTEWVREHGEFELMQYEMIAIAKSGELWLLVDQTTQEFCGANGNIEQGVYLIGFKSMDALAEWLG